MKKRAAYIALAKERKNDFAKIRQSQQLVRQEQKLPSWQDFLCKHAAEGNIEALAALRNREKRQRSISSELLTAPNIAAAKNVVLRDLKPVTRKNGDVVYKLTDGGIVRDEARQIRVDEVSPAAAFAALALAKERFGDQKLIIEGSEAFRKQIIDIVATRGLDIKFEDSIFETERQKAVDERPARSSRCST